MQQSGKIRLGGGNVGSLTPETILYGKATYITDIDYSNITLNKLVFKEPLTFSKCNITGTLNSSNEISIDRKLIYYKDEVNSIFQKKLNQGLGIVIDNNINNISVNFSDGGWTSNINNNYLYSSSKIGIGITNPSSILHIYDNTDNSSSSFIKMQNSINSFNFSFTNDNYFSLNNKIRIKNDNNDINSLLVLDNDNVSINKKLNIDNNLYFTDNNNYSEDRIYIYNNSTPYSYSSWLIDIKKIATQDYVRDNLILIDTTILRGVGSFITNIDYNRITLNKLRFQSPLSIDSTNNQVSFDTNSIGWTIDNNSNNIYLNELYNNFNLGIGNTKPLSYLHIGNYINTHSRTNTDPSLIISKIDDYNDNKNFKIGLDENKNFSIGNLNINNNNNNWTKQFIIYNNANPNSIVIDDLNNTNINSRLIINSNLIINNNSSIVFNNNNNNNFNINSINNIFNINFNNTNLFIINNLGNIGIGTSPISSAKLIINGNLNILSNISSLSFFSSNGNINNLTVNSNLNINNVNSIIITNSSTITTRNITITNLTNTNNINNNNLITTTNLNVSSTINSTNLIVDNINNNLNINSSTINTNSLNVATTITGTNINNSDTIDTFKIIANNINNASLITTNDLTVINSLNANDLTVTNSLNTNNINNTSLIISDTINTNSLNTDTIENRTVLNTNSINSTTINNTDIINTNYANINSTLNANSIIATNLNINTNIITNTISIKTTTTTNILICNNNINIGATANKPINSFLQIYDPIDKNNISKSTFIISGRNNNFRFGYDLEINDKFIFGSFNNTNATWNKQLIINSSAPTNSLAINSKGNIGIGIDTNINSYRVNDIYKLNIGGSLNANEIYKNGEVVVTSSTLSNTINNSLISYTNTNDLVNNYINKTYLNYVIDDNNNTVQNYINNFLTITSNVYSPILRFPEKTYNLASYVKNINLDYYLNNDIYAYKENINVINTDINTVDTIYSYEIYTSSKIDTVSYLKASLFNYDTNNIPQSNASSWNYTNYDANGLFNNNSINTVDIISSNQLLKNLNNYYGDYIIIKLPKPLVLNKFRFYSLNNSLIYAPGNWKCIYLNSSINSSWQELSAASLSLSQDRLNTSDYKTDIYKNYYYEKTLTNNIINCDYLGFIFNTLAKKSQIQDTAKIHLELARIELFFNQIVQPIYISSNVLKNYLINYPTINLLSNKQEKLIYSNGLKLTNNNILSVDPLYILNISGGGNYDQNSITNLTNVIENYINSLNNVWTPTTGVSGTPNIYYYNLDGCVGIGTSNPNYNPNIGNYKLDVYGNINCDNINISSNLYVNTINSVKLYGDGSSIRNLSYANISTTPNLTNLNNIIYDGTKNNYYSSNLNATFSIGYNYNDTIYKLNVNGSIFSSGNINAINNIQENGVSLKDTYLSKTIAASTYLNING